MAKSSIRNIQTADLIPGALVRICYTDDHGRTEASVSGFSDCIVAKVEGTVVHLLRPRATFDKGRAVVRSEEFRVEAARIVDRAHWQLVLNSRGEPENYAR